MNNLMTRKIILGLLMGLVLAFGVQGVAEAITDPAISSANLNPNTIQNVGGPLTITITLSPDDPTRRETVSISKSSGIDFTGIFFGLSSISLTEDDEDLTTGDTSNGTNFIYRSGRGVDTETAISGFSIPIRFNNKGRQTVTIRSTDYDDTDGTDDGSWSYTYTYYVRELGTKTTTVSLVSSRSGIVAGANHQIEVHNGDSGHYQVTYTTVPTGGSFQIEQPDGSLTALTADNSSSAFDVLLAMSQSYQVTANVEGSDDGIETVSTYIIGSPELAVGFPGDTDRDGTVDDTTVVGNKDMGGRINQVLDNAFSAHVTDGSDDNVPGVVVTFRVSSGGDAGGYLVFDSNNTGTLVDSSNRRILDANGNPTAMDTATVLHVRTAASGIANVDFQLGTNRKQDVTVSALRQSKTVSAYAGESVSGNQLVEPSSVVSRASGRAGEYELRVKAVDEDGDALVNAYVEFRTSDGDLEDSGTGASSSLGRLGVRTDTRGKAFVFFDPKDDSSSPRVTAHLLDLGDDNTRSLPNPGTPENDDSVVDDVVFDIGGTVTRRDPPPPPPQTTNRLTIFTTGEGLTRSVTVNALTTADVSVPGLSVLLSGTALTTPQTVTTGTAVTITLPSTPDTYTLIATDPNGTFDLATINITVSAPGTLAIRTVGTRSGTQQSITVTASGGTIPSGGLIVTLNGVASPRTVIIPSGQTSVSRNVTLPSATSAHTVYASAPGFSDSPTITIPAPGTTPDTTPDTTGRTGVADSIEIDGSRSRSGTVNQAMRLRARVLDANNNGVSDVRVTFSVLAPGRGRLSQRGNGRAIRVNTDRTGYASASLMPLGGDLIVEAKAAGVTAAVSFIIAVGEAAAPSTGDTTTRDTGTTTPRTEINPVVQVNASQRPPMLWVDGGKIYALVGADVEEFGSGVEGAMNIAVGGGKVYWTEMTGESSGTINSAKLDGSGVKELKKIKAVPMGIAVDTAGDKLYWTNSRGRIQSADLDGSGIENVMLDLPDPMDIAVARGILYWTQYDATEGEGNVGIANATGRGTPKYISTGADAPGSIAIGGNKVYWTEMTGSNAGTINSASLNGSGAEELNDIRAVPMGIGVDTARSKLYWTNSRGRVQSANLEGRKIEKIVDGLGNPGDMVLSNSITAPAKAPTTDAEQTASTSKYDINGDGSVDSADVDMLLLAVLAELTDAKYDVNGDGEVDAKDVRAVNKNVDPGAASAPTLLGTKLSAVQIDRLKEQIDLLIASGDRSPDTMRILTYLQQLIVMARPEKTQLLANYPNPFNPETWIPYELATDTTVKITIYNTQGVVIRTLELGHQSAGYYTGRDRAAYWDGRNAFGEQVASGIYFYQFETDEISSMRKMVILK